MRLPASFFLIALLAPPIASAQAVSQTPPEIKALLNQCIKSAQQNADSVYEFNFTENWSTITTEPAPIVNAAQAGPSNSGNVSTRDTRSSSDNKQTQEANPRPTIIQYDVTFIDTFPFRRRTAVNGIPLSPEEAHAEQLRYEKEFARIRALTPDQRMEALRDQHALIFDPADLAAHYTCRASGQAKISGNLTNVIDCRYLRDTAGLASRKSKKNLPEKNAFPSSITFWIDPYAHFFRRTRMVLSADEGEYGKGTVVTNQWASIDGVWHQTSTHIEFNGVQGQSGGIVDDQFSNFRRFSSDVTFVPPPAKFGAAAAPQAPRAPSGP